MSKTLNKLNHIVELDGLRGIAVLLVMLYHFVHVPFVSGNRMDEAFLDFFHIGWIGVDIFFVLSGFLITRILLNSKTGDNYFGDFYYKRTLRIFPLYYLYLAFIFFVFFPLVYDKVTLHEQTKIDHTIESQSWLWFYLSNIKQVIDGKFLGGGVGHLWSLSIEEQFYILWPLIVYFLSIKNLKKVVVLIVVVAIILRIVLFINHVSPLSIYVFTFTRFDSLAIGGLVAMLLTEEKVFPIFKLKVILGFAAAVIVAMLCMYGPRPDVFPQVYLLGFTLIAVSVAIIIILIQKDENFFLKPLLNLKPFIVLGKYSYALYLFHPLIRQLLLKVSGTPWIIWGSQLPWVLMFICAGIICSMIAAWFSWNLFEKWFLKLKNKPILIAKP